MSIEISWQDILLRLALTALAAGAIGFNREEHGRAAGFRTSLLVALAAAYSMIQVNLLLGMRGKGPDSFVVVDLMRLPLGILSGMGFIGGGAILKRGDAVKGVTTAATLWFLTVMGLCFGGGQIILGLAAFASAMIILTVLKRVDQLKEVLRARLVVVIDGETPTAEEVRTILLDEHFKVGALAVTRDVPRRRQNLRLDVSRQAKPSDAALPAVVERLSSMAGVRRVTWTPK